ncbi:hypothetical protein G7054_g6520 [Neopestalotiopsis clavispora]|nr:hypothetical protein G7054_g6520 [Neopestalotiopsis clavispora]
MCVHCATADVARFFRHETKHKADHRGVPRRRRARVILLLLLRGGPAAGARRLGHRAVAAGPDAFAKAKQHRIDAEARGEDPYAEYKKKVAATEPSSSGIERIYRWAEKKIHKKE